jgi:hypothetical protein
MFTSIEGRPRDAILAAVVAAALSFSAAAASAATVLIDTFTPGDVTAAQVAKARFLARTDPGVLADALYASQGYRVQAYRVETFSSYAAWDGTAGSGTTNPGATNVGSFTTLGGRGTGGTAIKGGHGLEVRQDNMYEWGGRYGLESNKWLDSNDTYGMAWQVSGLDTFNALTFFLTDVADVGAKFTIKVGETLSGIIVGENARTANGTIHLVRILLPEPVSNLLVELRHDRRNDGFGIDGVMVARIAPIPVPPAAALLVSGVVLLAGLRRRRRAA